LKSYLRNAEVIMNLQLVCVFATLLAAAPLAAAENVLTFDPSTTTITFFLEATGHDVHGTLALADGQLRFDPQSGEVAGKITIDASRAESGNAKRDKKMHNKVLETATYPEIVFVPSRIEGTVAPSGSSEVTLVGTVAIHGGEHEVELPTTVEFADGNFTAHATLTVPYVAWGMKDPSVFILRVGKEVSIDIEAAGTRSTATVADLGGR